MNEQMKDGEIEIDLMEIFRVLLKNVWVLILCLILGASLAFGATKLLVTPKYQASAMIYILSKSDGKTGVSSYSDVQIGQQLIQDFETLATTRTVVENVISELELDTTYEQLVSMITISDPSNTILKITVENEDPVLAKDIANAMSDATATHIAEVMVTDKPTTVDVAVTPDKPSSPNTVRDTAIGGILGLLIAAAVIIIRMMMDDTIKDKNDVEKYLGLTTLAAIPMNISGDDKKSRRRKSSRR